MTTPTETKTKSAPPIHRVRLGDIEVTIWEKDSLRGPFQSLTFSRSYKDGETWKRTGAFNLRDLDTLEAAIHAAREWLKANRPGKEAA